MVDSLLRRYMEMVYNTEGITFIYEYDLPEFTTEENKLLKELSRDIQKW